MTFAIVSILVLGAVPGSPIVPSLPPPIAGAPPDHAALVEPIGPARPALAAGQWTYDSQHGWQWMPYDFSRIRLPFERSLANKLVLSPAFGSGWRIRPWVLGYRGVARWDTLEPRHFEW
jgi:hypothetical protein